MSAQPQPQAQLKSQLPLLDLDALRVLVAIADTGNFSAAAESVFRTPSAVSMQVKKIEEIVGRPLFHRDSRSVTATTDGEMLVKHGRRMLELNRDMMMRYIEPEVAGVVRLGAPDDMAERLLPDMLRRFANTHCCVNVDVVVQNSVDLEKAVDEGSLDLAIVSCDPNSSQAKQVEIVYREALTWAGARSGVAYEKDPLPISVWEEGCAWRNSGLNSLEANQRNYRIAFMSAHISGQRAAILADLAVAPIPLSSCTDGIISLGDQHGMPELNDYAVGLILADNLSTPAQAAADHLRESFTACTNSMLKQ
ncbi:MAG: LysR family transcriptional regulator [Granulosicoccus sp.]|nr:LysR family transcriptional regulator [Granulosicoccus sp.]